jgi:hypothetical protein
METSSIERQFRESVSEQVRLLPEGLGRFRVFTPFTLDDGDRLSIVLRRQDNGWYLSDEGHTYMHLSYKIPVDDLMRGNRAKLISNALEFAGVVSEEGELLLRIPEQEFGSSLFTFVQTLIHMSDVTYLSRERVRSTFLEDFRQLMIEVGKDVGEVYFEWHEPANDPKGLYSVDCRIGGPAVSRPALVFALANDDRARDATISLLKFESWGLNFQSVGIFEDLDQISSRVVGKFVDVAGKVYSGLEGNEPRIVDYIRHSVGSNLV